MRFLKPKDKSELALVIVFCVFFVFWLFWAVFSIKPVWGDEYFTFEISKLPCDKCIYFALRDAHPPLFFILSHLMISTSDNLGSIRALAWLFGFITLFAIGSYKGPVSIHASRIFSILFLTSPFFLLFTPMARYYSLFTLLVVVSFWLKWKTNNRWLHVVGTTIIDIMMLYTNYTAGLILIGSNIFLLLKKRNDLSRFNLALIWILPWIFFIPIISFFWDSLTRISAQEFFVADFGSGLNGFIIRLFYTLHVFISGEFVYPWQPSAIVMLLLTFYFVYLFSTRFKSDIKLLFMLGIILPALITILASVTIFSLGMEFLPPRIGFVQPFLLMAIAIGLSSLRNPRVRVALLILFILGNLHADYKLAKRENFLHSTYIIPYDEISTNITSRDVANKYGWGLREKYTPYKDIIVHDDNAIEYYFYQNGWKNLESGIMYFNVIRADRILSELEEENKRFWVVYSPKDITPHHEMTKFLDELYRRGYKIVELKNYVRESEKGRRMKEIFLERSILEYKKTLAVFEREALSTSIQSGSEK